MIRWLPILVMVYMVAALTWWSVLLLNQNEQLFQLKKKLLYQPEQIVQLEQSHERQKMMVIGEGIVFALSMMLGTYFIYKSNIREINLGNRQRNFLLSVSHELKSPLTSINLGLETLRKRALSQEKIAEVAEMALKESKRLENLITAILTAAKVEQKNYSPALEWLNLSELISSMISQLEVRHPEVSFSFHNENEEAMIRASRQDMQSVFYNLLENAVKYGKLTPVAVSLKSDGENWLIEVSDQGPGIPAGERQKVFEKFYRIGNEETRSSKGTGLGLYIVKKSILNHKGSISIYNNTPSGTIFRINLPKQSANENPAG